MTQDEINYGEFKLHVSPERSEWKCYLFGCKGYDGITYRPKKGDVPNWFVRWMMRICLGCTWVKEKQ